MTAPEPRWWTHVVARRGAGGTATLELIDGRGRVAPLMGDFHKPAWGEAEARHNWPAVWWTAGALLFALTGAEDSNDPRREALVAYLGSRSVLGWQATAGDLNVVLFAAHAGLVA